MEAFRIALYARTLSYLKARQIAYLMVRRIWRAPNRPPGSRSPVHVRSGVRMEPPLTRPMQPEGEHEFRFLNVSSIATDGRVDWASAEMSKLWRYNLHYFD